MKLFAATAQGESSTIQYHLTKNPQLFLALSGVRSALSPWFADYPSGWRLTLAPTCCRGACFDSTSQSVVNAIPAESRPLSSKPISETDIDERNAFGRGRLLQESPRHGTSEVQGC